MTVPSQRRRDPQRISRGGELAALAIGAAVIAVALAALAGLGTAAALWGGGWVWPHGIQTIDHVLDGILHGQPGHGLSRGQLRRIPGPTPVYACVAAFEVLLLMLSVLAGRLVARYRRPGDARGGMATRREAQQALGLGQLRGARAIIRPDRYGPAAEGPSLEQRHTRTRPQPFPLSVRHPQIRADQDHVTAGHVTVDPNRPNPGHTEEPHDERHL